LWPLSALTGAQTPTRPRSPLPSPRRSKSPARRPSAHQGEAAGARGGRHASPPAVVVARACAEARQPTRPPARRRSQSPGRAPRPGSRLALRPAGARTRRGMPRSRAADSPSWQPAALGQWSPLTGHMARMMEALPLHMARTLRGWWHGR